VGAVGFADRDGPVQACHGAALLREAVDLCVGALEGHVAQPLRPGELAGTRDGGCGDVDPERAACLSCARGLSGRLPGPASDVQDMVVEPDATGPAQYPVVPVVWLWMNRLAGRRCCFWVRLRIFIG
jgi:hypothetical protein